MSLSPNLPARSYNALGQWSPTFLAAGIGFVEDSVSVDWGEGDGLEMIQAQYIYFCCYYISFIRSSGIISWRLGTPAVGAWSVPCVLSSVSPNTCSI